MPTDFYAFGEILWDCLPSGRHAGGAPFNVTAHLAQIGVSASLISCIGQDSLGDEILKVAQDKKVNTEFITRARIGLATGTVLVTVDANGNATYELVQPAAWDEIRVSAEALEAVSKSRALIYGSLAGRSPYNLDQLAQLLEVKGQALIFRREPAAAVCRSTSGDGAGEAGPCPETPTMEKVGEASRIGCEPAT